MQKTVFNFSINALMTLCMSAIIGTGFLIKYKLISGQERWEVYGRKVELYFFGLARHQWGMIHLILGFVLLGLLVVHIIFHWKVITTVFKRIVKQPLVKNLVVLVFVIICAVMLAFPFFINPEVEIITKGSGRQVTIVTDLNSEYN